MTLAVVALLVWFAVSIPATVIIGHILGELSRDSGFAARERRAPTHGHGFVRS